MAHLLVALLMGSISNVNNSVTYRQVYFINIFLVMIVRLVMAKALLEHWCRPERMCHPLT